MQVTDTTSGTDSFIFTPIPNGGNGILITGHAHNNAIGGYQPSIEPRVTVSANRGYGIMVTGSARNNVIYHTAIGTDGTDTYDLGNNLGGIYLGAGTSGTVIGGTASALQVQMLYSRNGAGLTIQSSKRNKVVGDEIENNKEYGLYGTGVCTGSIVQSTVITANSPADVNLTKSRGITYIPS